MNFRNWLITEMAMVSKRPIDISSPEVIERLKTSKADARFPYWSGALAGILKEIQQHIQAGERADQAVNSLMRRTRDAGIDPLQTRQINFSPTDSATHYRAQRYMRKWIYQSLAQKLHGQFLPNNFFDKKNEIVERGDGIGAELYKAARQGFDISMLIPNIGIEWNPNSMVPDENSYDDKKLEKNQLKQVANNMGAKSAPDLKKMVQDYAIKRLQAYVASGKTKPDIDMQSSVEEIWNRFVMNLMRFNPAHPSPIEANVKALQMWIWNTAWSVARRAENRPAVQMQQKPKGNPYIQPKPEPVAV